jgi:hypothetical protein
MSVVYCTVLHLLMMPVFIIVQSTNEQRSYYILCLITLTTIRLIQCCLSFTLYYLVKFNNYQKRKATADGLTIQDLEKMKERQKRLQGKL